VDGVIPFGQDLDGDGECDRDEDGDGVLDLDFSTPGDVCSGLTDEQCELIELEAEILGAPCDAGYNGSYDAWVRNTMTDGARANRFRHISLSEAEVIVQARPVNADRFLGVDLRWEFATDSGRCLVIVEIWERDTGLSHDFRFSLFFPAIDDREIPALRDGSIAFSMCWDWARDCQGNISDLVCESDVMLVRSGTDDVISCWGSVSEFDWQTDLNRNSLLIPPPFATLPAFSATSDYYIAQIVADFWDCFSSDTEAGLPFVDDGPAPYDSYSAFEFDTGGGGGGGGFLSGLPFVGSFFGSASDILSGIPCGMFEIFVSDAQAIQRVVNGGNQCRRSGNSDVCCSQFSLIGEHLRTWDGAINDTISCDGEAIPLFNHDFFDRIKGSAADDIELNPLNVCAPAEGQEPGLLYTAGNIFRPWMSGIVIIVMFLFVIRIVRNLFNV